MGLIKTVSDQIDTTLVSYVQDVFTAVASPISILLKAVALIALLFVAVNNVMQLKQINFSSYLHWGIRYALVFSFATIWANFQGIYNLLVEIPADYIALLMKTITVHYMTHRTDVLDPSVIKDTATAMDEFGHAVVWIAYDFFRDTSISDIGMSLRNVFIGALIIIIGGIFLAAGVIIVTVSKVGFALAISLAPLAIVMLMMEQTKPHFESWSRFTMGFVVVPLLLGALMALVLYCASFILANAHPDSTHKDLYVGFIMVMIAALVLLFQLPTMASTLAAASVAAVGGGAAFAAASMAKGALMGSAGKAMSMGSAAKNMANTARETRGTGGSKRETFGAVFRSMRQSAGMRQARRDQRLAKGIKGDSKPSPRTQPTSRPSGGGSAGRSGHSVTPEQQNLNRP
jgi:type IV secretion system protein VirB6